MRRRCLGCFRGLGVQGWLTQSAARVSQPRASVRVGGPAGREQAAADPAALERHREPLGLARAGGSGQRKGRGPSSSQPADRDAVVTAGHAPHLNRSLSLGAVAGRALP